ncbi:MAG TPA: hypothetical protein GX008_02780 [Firmicutes bacterium]|nr:MAG: hypothetical protein AA931_02490 [Peptococcaceae bacterium 1109]HHT72619.1 hypothetical protein [Bacillota bacterium]
MYKPQVTLILAAVCLTLLAGCTLPAGDGLPVHTQGQVAVMATIASMQEGSGVSQARIILARGKHVFEWDVPVVGLDISAELEVPIGNWQLTILLMDDEGTIQFQSAPQEIDVMPNNTQLVEVVLRPGDGLVNLTIDLGDSPFWQNASRARVYFNDEREELIWEGIDGPINHVFSLAPGTYDLLIELYTESFHAANRIAPGIWQVIEVQAAQELVLNWQPATETLTVNAVIYMIPEAPQNLTANMSQGKVHLSWDPHPNPFVTGYFVYSQSDPFERPDILTPIPVLEPQFIHDVEELSLLDARSITYSVAAVGYTGVAGYRSSPLVVELGP